jgi:hypothetical protein
MVARGWLEASQTVGGHGVYRAFDDSEVMGLLSSDGYIMTSWRRKPR